MNEEPIIIKDYPAPIAILCDPHKKAIGVIRSLESLLHVQLQIKQKQLGGYVLLFEDASGTPVRLRIFANGELSFIPNGFFGTDIKQLSDLMDMADPCEVCDTPSVLPDVPPHNPLVAHPHTWARSLPLHRIHAQPIAVSTRTSNRDAGLEIYDSNSSPTMTETPPNLSNSELDTMLTRHRSLTSLN